MINEIYLGKWENVMPKIDSNSIDLIITSPPYNVNLGNNKLKKDKYESYDDNMPYNQYLAWMKKLFTECNRVLRVGGRLCVNIGDGANGSVPTHVDFTHILLHLNDKLPHADFYPEYKVEKLDLDDFKMMTTIVWDKKQIGSSTAWGSWKSPSQPSFPTQFEFIIVVGKGSLNHPGDKEKITIDKEEFMRNSRALWSFPPETAMMKKYNHPAAFPEELPQRLIQQLSYADDVVLDPFSGAGTTCAVAKKLGRKYIGIEMSEEYHATSLERLGKTAATINAEGEMALDWSP